MSEDSQSNAVDTGGEANGSSSGVSAAAQARSKFILRASKSWTGQLVDLTGRNNLLYYRDLKVGTLPLDDVSPAMLFDALAGKTVTLSKLFPEEEARADALRRARTVRNKTKAHYEERGLETLYLAVGMASWSGQKSASNPAAPVLLVPVRLAPRGAAQEEFELTVTGELEVNPTFLQMLKAEFEVECDPSELLESGGIEGIIDTPEELSVAYEWLREQCSVVPGFEVKERFVIGNFSYAKLPMVRDLEGSLEAMAEHDLIAALAGDPGAQEALRQAGENAEIPSPDYTPPADEFLVLDADASQNYAINAVLAGRSLIIKGPPGTGKSQTISNLISTLVARGKKVLFVAEKRAAIDAVLGRLEDVGLEDLVLDLHGGVSSRRKTAQDLALALKNNARLSRPALDGVHQKLELRRSQLSERVRALHDPRAPWAISFYEVQCQLMDLPEEVGTAIRFRGDDLRKLSSAAVEQAEEDLDAFVSLGGPGLSRSGSLWAGATVVSSEEAQAQQRRVEALRSEMSQLLTRLDDAALETGVRKPHTFTDWEDLLGDWANAEEVLQTFAPGLFELELTKLLVEAEPMRHSAAARISAAVINGEYRAARNAFRAQLLPDQKLRPSELFDSAANAADLLKRWRENCVDEDGSPRPCAELQALQDALGAVRSQLDALEVALGRSTPTDLVSDAEALCDELLQDVGTLSKMPELHRLRQSLESVGLEPLLTEIEPRDLDAMGACQILRYAWLHSVREEMQLTDSRLGAFDGEQHRRAVSEYQQADREHIETTAQRVRRLCAEQATASQDADQPAASLLRAEAAKKRKHLSIRELFSAAPEVMTSLKPCWVMSPLVVSQVLPSDQPYFDVVVFDEASQVRPAEAMPAILRGRQLVVAGDERQLPPTDFFSGVNPEGEEEDEDGAVLAVDGGYESILEAMDPFVKFQMLEWHYRSRDERLIAFSNVHLYDRGLTTFPGVVGPDCIQHVEVPFEPGRPGSDVSSGAEVKRVVELILDHAGTRPQQTLGVIAMGIKHANRIEEALRDSLSGREEEFEEFFDESREEPFFIKNLERVQGDERDAIILSIGYGKNENGKLLYNFGPLNEEGGERRLNVAVTRAKERMTLVSSFSHRDMDPDRSSKKGVQLMRAYIEYCATNGAQIGEVAARIPELNPFEVNVRDQLTRAGLQLAPQYGSSGYRIDFAVKHPEQPGRMILAIECDGASYHSAPTARDRDRLRQEQLERLGWNFHRIWSQDWFNNKQQEIERAKQAYEAALKSCSVHAHGKVSKNKRPTEDTRDNRVLESSPIRQGVRPVPPRDGRGIDAYTHDELVALALWIESDGLLRTKLELCDAMIRELGFKRRGPKIAARLDHAVDALRPSLGDRQQ